MLLAVDVDYRNDDKAVAAGILFAEWQAARIETTFVARLCAIQPYRPGQFYERELPCIRAVLDQCPCRLAAVIIDGYVVLGRTNRPGLGSHLYQALDGEVPVIGVAKSRYHDTPPDTEVLRGDSKRPLYVTSIGMDAFTARQCVHAMHGAHRMPTMLSAADRACRIAEFSE